MKLSTLPEYARSYVSAKPSYLIFYVTSRCNMSCEFCFYADSLNQPWKDGLSLDEITKVAKSLGHCVQVTLTGGEPFLRLDLAEVVLAFIEHAGARNITIPTHGGFTDRIVALLERVLAAHPEVELRIAFSIDGLGQKHDEVRKSKGAFVKVERSFHAVKALQAKYRNLHLIITTVASKYNKDDLREFFDYAGEHLVADDHALLLARGKTKQDDAKDIRDDEFTALVQYMESKTKRGESAGRLHSRILGHIEKEIRHVAAATYREDKYQLPCVAGGKFLVIYESGEVFPCEILDTMNRDPAAKERFGGSFRIGNVRDTDYDVGTLLTQPRAAAIRKYIDDSKCFCTFECAIAASVVFNPKTLIKSVLRPTPAGA